MIAYNPLSGDIPFEMGVIQFYEMNMFRNLLIFRFSHRFKISLIKIISLIAPFSDMSWIKISLKANSQTVVMKALNAFDRCTSNYHIIGATVSSCVL